MTTYYVMICLVFFCCFLAQKFCIKSQCDEKFIYTKTPSANVSLFIACSILVVVASMRYHVGTDYNAYYNLYFSYKVNEFGNFDILGEPLMPLIGKIASFIYDSPYTMFLFVSIIVIGPALYSIYKETDDFVFVTLLYIFTGCWHSSFNGMRQCLAVTIVFLGRRYITDRKFWKYLLVCFIAFLAHRSALFCVSFYFIYTEKFTTKRLLIITAITLVLSRNYESIFDFIGWMNDSEFVMTDYAAKSVNVLRTLVGCCPSFVGIYYAYTRKLDKQQFFYIYMMVINAAIRIATADSAYLYRLGMFPAIFLPLGLTSISNATAAKYKKTFRYIIIIFYFLFWIYEMTNSRTLSNFEWIFGK